MCCTCEHQAIYLTSWFLRNCFFSVEEDSLEGIVYAKMIIYRYVKCIYFKGGTGGIVVEKYLGGSGKKC